MPLRSALALGFALVASGLASADTVFVSCYTNADSKGIYALSFDENTGALGQPELAVETANPSFIIIPSHGDRLFAVNELDGAQGEASSFAIDRGHLKFLSATSSRGSGPCHLALSNDAKQLFVANYQSGTLASIPVDADGRLQPATQFFQFKGSGPNAARQAGPHAHCTVLDPTGSYLLVCDLGSDRIWTYAVDPSTDVLTPAPAPFTAVAPGSGPRHLQFSPSGKFAYLVNEMASTVTALRWHPETGALEAFQTISMLPEGFAGKNTAAELQFDSGGRHLYASNRGDDSIVTFDIAADGRLTFLQRTPVGGRTPRFFALDPSQHWLLVALQDSGQVRVLRRDPATGQLSGTDTAVNLSRPVCLAFGAE